MGWGRGGDEGRRRGRKKKHKKTLNLSTSNFLLIFSRYVSRKYYEAIPELKKAIDQIHSGFFSPDQPELFHDLTYQLLNHDTYEN